MNTKFWLLLRFPEAYVLLRLLQIAAGLWPTLESGRSEGLAEVVAQTMLNSLQNRHQQLVAHFEFILCRPVALLADSDASQLVGNGLPWKALLVTCRVCSIE